MKDMDSILDARLRAAFAPPGDVEGMARDVLRSSGVSRPASRWRLVRSIAAMLLAAVGIAWFGWFASRDASTPPPVTISALDAGQFQARISAQLGAPLACTAPGESSQLVTQCMGTQLDYRGGSRVPLQGPFGLPADWPGDPTATVFAGHFEARVVVVVIERVELTGGGSFHPTEEFLVHQRQLQGYTLYEISSENAPVCLDEFYSGERVK